MIATLLLQASATTAQPMHQYILLGSIVLIFYFFMIRPQQRRQQAQRRLLATLKKGVPLVTIGGIHGTVYEVSDDTVTLEIDRKGAKITVSKGAIAPESIKQPAHKQ